MHRLQWAVVITRCRGLSSVSVLSVPKPQLQDAVRELAPVTFLLWVFPLSAHYFEGNVVVRRFYFEHQKWQIGIFCWHNFVVWRFARVQVRVENIEPKAEVSPHSNLRCSRTLTSSLAQSQGAGCLHRIGQHLVEVEPVPHKITAKISTRYFFCTYNAS